MVLRAHIGNTFASARILLCLLLQRLGVLVLHFALGHGCIFIRITTAILARFLFFLMLLSLRLVLLFVLSDLPQLRTLPEFQQLLQQDIRRSQKVDEEVRR